MMAAYFYATKYDNKVKQINTYLWLPILAARVCPGNATTDRLIMSKLDVYHMYSVML